MAVCTFLHVLKAFLKRVREGKSNLPCTYYWQLATLVVWKLVLGDLRPSVYFPQ